MSLRAVCDVFVNHSHFKIIWAKHCLNLLSESGEDQVLSLEVNCKMETVDN